MYIRKVVLVIILFIISVGGFFFPLVGAAQQEPVSLGLSVSPQVFELDIFPGEKIVERIKIGNLSEVAMPIEVRMTDFTAEENSGEMLFDESLQDLSIASRKWFKIEKPNFILERGEKEEIQFTISVPENAEPGGHYSVMLFEPRLPSFYFKPGQPRTIPVVGVLFLTSVKTFSLEPEVEQKLEIVEFSLPEEERLVALENFLSMVLGSVAQAAEFTISKKSPSEFILRVKNNDIYHIKPSGKVLIYNFWGQKVGEAEVPRRTILPGKIRQFPIEFSPKIPKLLDWLPASISHFLVQNFFVGRYQAKLELQGRGPLSTLEPTILTVLTFFSLPWQFWLTFLTTFGALIFFTIKYRKRIQLSLRTLLGK